MYACTVLCVQVEWQDGSEEHKAVNPWDIEVLDPTAAALPDSPPGTSAGVNSGGKYNLNAAETVSSAAASGVRASKSKDKAPSVGNRK